MKLIALIAAIALILALQVSQADSQWIRTNGPGSYYAKFYSPDGQKIYAASTGVFMSTDSGITWSAIGLQNLYINAISFSGSKILAGSSDAGVFMSTDEGKTWNSSSTGLPSAPIYSLVSRGREVYAGTYGRGIFLSTDEGSRWTVLSKPLKSSFIYSLAFTGKNLIAGTHAGIFLKMDGDSNWIEVDSNLRLTYIRSLVVRATSVYAGTSAGVLRSTDNGESWSAAGLTSESIGEVVTMGSVLIAGSYGHGLFRSTDDGVSWSSLKDRFANSSVYSLGVCGSILFSGIGDESVSRSSDNGISWRNSGLPNTRVISLVVGKTNLYAKHLITAPSSRISFTESGGLNWTNVINSSALSATAVQSMFVYPEGTDNVLEEVNGGYLHYSTDAGTSWSYQGMLSTTILCSASRGSKLFIGTHREGVKMSSDTGRNWSTRNTSFGSMNVVSIVIGDNEMFAATDAGGVYMSTDDGLDWQTVNNGLTNLGVRCLALSGKNLFAATSSGVYLTTDRGQSWSAVNEGLTSANIQTLLVCGMGVFALDSYDHSLFLTTNGGLQWKEVEQKLADKNILSLVIQGTTLFAGTDGNGVIRRPLSELMSVPAEDQETVALKALNICVPNPVRDLSTLEFSIPQALKVRLTVFTSLGQEITTLLNEQLEAGEHNVEWSATNVPAGVYFCRLQVGEQSETIMLVVVK